MTVEDYMYLPKKRLAEMLAERDAAAERIDKEFPSLPVIPQPETIPPRWCHFIKGYCSHNGLCPTCPDRQITAIYTTKALQPKEDEE